MQSQTISIPTRFSIELEKMILNFILKKNAKEEPKTFFKRKYQTIL